MKTFNFDRSTYSPIKLTIEEAIKYGIDPAQDEARGVLKTVLGSWPAVSYKALCISSTFGAHSFVESTTIYGVRTMHNIRSAGYGIEGRVSIGGKKYTAFDSSITVEVEGKSINVAVIFARVKDQKITW
jgi:hypothetical protein